jgi:hypothetical protein
MRTAWYGVAQVDLRMASLRRDAWMHVYIEAAYEFSDDINLMSRAISGEEYQINGDFTAGRIASVALWGRALPVHEVREAVRLCQTLGLRDKIDGRDGHAERTGQRACLC